MNHREREILRPLAETYAEISARPVMAGRRDAWRKQNSFRGNRPLIYTRAFAFHELPESRLACEGGLARSIERELRRKVYWASLGDDSVFEPWCVLRAAYELPEGGAWGLPHKWVQTGASGSAKQNDPPIKDPADAARIADPHHRVNEKATARNLQEAHEAIGDILPVYVDRAPAYRSWTADLSTELFYLRGMDALMMDTFERPDWLHGVLAHMRDGVLRTHEEAEQAGDRNLLAHDNQAMPYAEELQDPRPGAPPLARKDLWYFCASQEWTLFGPDQWDEFMFQYQETICRPFGLVAYGCCEDLTLKIPILRRLPNLRRIAVSPMADVAACAEAIGRDYILSYRPSPADMVSYDFDEDRIRRILRRDLEACRHCHVDITLKDVQTVQGDPERVRRWVAITREELDAIR